MNLFHFHKMIRILAIFFSIKALLRQLSTAGFLLGVGGYMYDGHSYVYRRLAILALLSTLGLTTSALYKLNWLAWRFARKPKLSYVERG